MFGQCLAGLIGVLAGLMRYPEDVDELSHDEVSCTRESARTRDKTYTVRYGIFFYLAAFVGGFNWSSQYCIILRFSGFSSRPVFGIFSGFSQYKFYPE